MKCKKLQIVDEMNTSERTGTFEQRREKSIPSDLEGIKSLQENTKNNDIGPFDREQCGVTELERNSEKN